MRKTRIRFLLISLISLFAVTSCGDVSSNVNNTIELNETRLTLDIYQEYDLVATNFSGDLLWTSSNPTIVTVDSEGHVSAQGIVGEAVIEVSSPISGNATCIVSTKNQLITPSIYAESQNGFVNVTTKPDISVRYDGNYYPLETYTLVSSDTSVALIYDDSFKGISLGEVTITVDATWKNRKLATRTFNVEILPEKAIILEQSVYDIYSVDDSSTVKKNEVEVNGSVYIQGQESNVDLVVSLPENDYLAAEGTTIKVINKYESPEPLTIKAEVSAINDSSIKASITVNLHSNNLKKDTMSEIEETYLADLNFETVDFGGREDVLKYDIPNVPVNQNKANPVWTDWNARVEFYETTTKNGVSAYNNIVDEGYEILAFDMYYLGTKGILIGSYASRDYFYNEVQINNPNILLVNSDNVATNTLTNDQWYTVYIKIKKIVLLSMETGQDSAALYISPCFVEDITYLDNIRYYYDMSALDNIEYALDLDKRELTIDSANPAKANVINEFVVYSPNYIKYQRNVETGGYTYDSSNAKAMDREPRSKITPANLPNGAAVKDGYKYFSFTYEYVTGSPKLYVFDIYRQANVLITLTPETVINSNLVKLYYNGKQVNRVIQNEEVTVVITIDGKSGETMYMTSNTNTIFKVNHFAYFKNTSFHSEFSYNEPLRVVFDNIDSAFVGTTYNIKELLTVEHNGRSISNYEIKETTFTKPIATMDNNIITFIATGEANVEIVIQYLDYQTVVLIKAIVYESNYLHVYEKEVEIYAGPHDYFVKTHKIEALAFLDGNKLSSEDLTIEFVDKKGFVTIDGSTVTGVSQGVEKIKVSIGSEDQQISKIIEVSVFSDYRTGSMSITVSDSNNPATYGRASETIAGVQSPYHYHAPVASWNNKLDVTITDHTNSSSYQTIIKEHLKYVTYYMLLTPGTTGRLAAIDPARNHTMLKLTAGGPIEGINENIKIYQNGEVVTSIAANTWYKVVVNYSNFQAEYLRGYTCNEFGYVKGDIYLHDIRYYHENVTDFN